MSQLYDNKNRQIIPRWYPFKTACLMGDLRSDVLLQIPENISSASMLDKIRHWRTIPNVSHAIDLVGSALVIGDHDNDDVHDAARFIIGRSDKVSTLGLEMASLYNSDREQSASEFLPSKHLINEQYLHIAYLKSVVRRYPRNAIAWSDLAYNYTLLGQQQQAEECMDVAVSIAGDNRFILRSATRCYLHLKSPEKALYHIHKSNLKTQDPWIVSSEIAVSESTGHKPRLLKIARNLLQNRNLSDWSLNELAGSLSTLERNSGSNKKAKKLLYQALKEPNENTLAQIEWLGRYLSAEITRPHKEIVAGFEADTWLLYRQGNHEEALEFAKKWYQFQPFSSRSAVLASYIASVCLEDDLEAIKIIEEAKKSSPDDLMLNNNYAFALASLNRIDKALAVISAIRNESQDERFSYTLAATKGLVRFRKGDDQRGRELYQCSINGFRKLQDHSSAATAAVFLAREEAILKSKNQKASLDEATKLAKQAGVKELISIAEVLAEKQYRH